jgi:HSP20 family protein
MALTTRLRHFDDFFNIMNNFENRISRHSNFKKFTPTFDVDMVENEKSYVITADIPGVSKDNINISIENGILSISAEKTYSRSSKDDDNNHYHFSERSHGSVSRSFYLPDNVKLDDEYTAKYVDGVLTLVFNKNENSRRKLITIE